MSGAGNRAILYAVGHQLVKRILPGRDNVRGRVDHRAPISYLKACAISESDDDDDALNAATYAEAAGLVTKFKARVHPRHLGARSTETETAVPHMALYLADQWQKREHGWKETAELDLATLIAMDPLAAGLTNEDPHILVHEFAMDPEGRTSFQLPTTVPGLDTPFLPPTVANNMTELDALVAWSKLPRGPEGEYMSENGHYLAMRVPSYNAIFVIETLTVDGLSKSLKRKYKKMKEKRKRKKAEKKVEKKAKKERKKAREAREKAKKKARKRELKEGREDIKEAGKSQRKDQEVRDKLNRERAREGLPSITTTAALAAGKMTTAEALAFYGGSVSDDDDDDILSLSAPPPTGAATDDLDLETSEEMARRYFGHVNMNATAAPTFLDDDSADEGDLTLADFPARDYPDTPAGERARETHTARWSKMLTHYNHPIGLRTYVPAATMPLHGHGSREEPYEEMLCSEDSEHEDDGTGKKHYHCHTSGKKITPEKHVDANLLVEDFRSMAEEEEAAMDDDDESTAQYMDGVALDGPWNIFRRGRKKRSHIAVLQPVSGRTEAAIPRSMQTASLQFGLDDNYSMHDVDKNKHYRSALRSAGLHTLTITTAALSTNAFKGIFKALTPKKLFQKKLAPLAFTTGPGEGASAGADIIYRYTDLENRQKKRIPITDFVSMRESMHDDDNFDRKRITIKYTNPVTQRPDEVVFELDLEAVDPGDVAETLRETVMWAHQSERPADSPSIMLRINTATMLNATFLREIYLIFDGAYIARRARDRYAVENQFAAHLANDRTFAALCAMASQCASNEGDLATRKQFVSLATMVTPLAQEFGWVASRVISDADMALSDFPGASDTPLPLAAEVSEYIVDLAASSEEDLAAHRDALREAIQESESLAPREYGVRLHALVAIAVGAHYSHPYVDHEDRLACATTLCAHRGPASDCTAIAGVIDDVIIRA